MAHFVRAVAVWLQMANTWAENLGVAAPFVLAYVVSDWVNILKECIALSLSRVHRRRSRNGSLDLMRTTRLYSSFSAGCLNLHRLCRCQPWATAVTCSRMALLFGAWNLVDLFVHRNLEVALPSISALASKGPYHDRVGVACALFLAALFSATGRQLQTASARGALKSVWLGMGILLVFPAEPFSSQHYVGAFLFFGGSMSSSFIAIKSCLSAEHNLPDVLLGVAAVSFVLFLAQFAIFEWVGAAILAANDVLIASDAMARAEMKCRKA